MRSDGQSEVQRPLPVPCNCPRKSPAESIRSVNAFVHKRLECGRLSDPIGPPRKCRTSLPLRAMTPSSNEMLEKITSARSLFSRFGWNKPVFFRKRKNRSDRPEPITLQIQSTPSARVKSLFSVPISRS